MGAVEKQRENENCVDNVWKFQLLHGGNRALGFGRYRMGSGHLFGRVCPDELLNYWTPVKKRGRLRKRTGSITSGNFSYYMGPIAHWVSVVTGGLWGFIWAGLSQWRGLLDACEKADPLEDENWVDNVWELQLIRGAHRPLGFARYRMRGGIYLGGFPPNGLLNYWEPVKKKARFRTSTLLLTSGNSRYYMGPIARWVLRVTGGV